MSTNTDRDFVTSLARGLEVLRCFTAERVELGSTEIARLTGLPQSTVWRLCHTLMQLGYLVPAGGDRMRAGLSVLALGGPSVARAGIAAAAYPGMAEIANRFDATVSMAGRVGNAMVVVQRAESPGRMRLTVTVGSALPMERSAVGAAYLAATSAEDRAATLSALRKESTPAAWADSQKWLDESLRTYKEHGWVLNMRRVDPELCAVGVPLISHDQRRIMALNCVGLASRMTVKQLTGPIASALMDLSRQVQPLL